MLFTTLAVVAIALSSASASPTEHENKRSAVLPLRRNINISSIKNLVQSGRDRIAARHGLRSSDVKRANSGAIKNEDLWYTVPVDIGGTIWNLVLDTGIYAQWGGPDLQGMEYTDNVSFGGLTIKSQSLGSASNSTGMYGADGILGLGPVGLTHTTVQGLKTVPTFMNNLKSQGSISTEVFGVSFRPEIGGHNNDVNGELTLGGLDTSKFTGSLTYFPTLKTGVNAKFWGVSISKFTYGSTTLSLSATAMVDTAFTVTTIPHPAYEAFLAASGAKNDNFTDLPSWTTKPTSNFGITFGSTTYELTPDQYLIPAEQYPLFGIPKGKYYAWIQDGGHSRDSALIGQKFLEFYYSVFDTTNSRIGFAANS
ncbi:related to rhizopuspepsin-2 precursor [Rhynchosporium graminicola]|uniref:Related to rhizopuspepsin-2 n=1 Tax=Rhynchosporium graminicola TaxID=2792576 RepID=A0A1E1LND4_9HELO|nr:related to rhizopuspepsin-2 precursor [Rhynchosporium commune]